MPYAPRAIRNAAASQLSPCCWGYCGTESIRQLVAVAVKVIAASADHGLASAPMPASTVAAISQARRGDENRRSVFSSLPSSRRAASRPTPYRTNGRHTFADTPTGDSSLSGILQQKGPVGLLSGMANSVTTFGQNQVPEGARH